MHRQSRSPWDSKDSEGFEPDSSIRSASAEREPDGKTGEASSRGDELFSEAALLLKQRYV